jgi:alpha-glucoside transport system permease protein
VQGNVYVEAGRAPSIEEVAANVSAWGTSSREITAYAPGDVADLGDGATLTVDAFGTYVWSGPDEAIAGRAPRIFVTALSPPEFTLANYDNVLFDPSNREGMSKAFFNTLTVTIPATIIPILVAAFAAYALAWMDFPGRALLIAAVVGLLVVPLQLALIPLLQLHNDIGIGKGYLGVWLAHTGFGLPLAIYLLRNYMVGLPRDIIENAKVDGATDFQIFTKIILPLSFPALASLPSSSFSGPGTTFWWPWCS